MVITALGLYMMALPHFLTGYNHINTSDTSSDNSDQDKSREGLCNSDYHLNSLENGCAEDGSRVVDWFGLIIMFLGIALTGVGNSLFWCFGIIFINIKMIFQSCIFRYGVLG